MKLYCEMTPAEKLANDQIYEMQLQEIKKRAEKTMSDWDKFVEELKSGSVDIDLSDESDFQ